MIYSDYRASFISMISFSEMLLNSRAVWLPVGGFIQPTYHHSQARPTLHQRGQIQTDFKGSHLSQARFAPTHPFASYYLCELLYMRWRILCQVIWWLGWQEIYGRKKNDSKKLTPLCVCVCVCAQEAVFRVACSRHAAVARFYIIIVDMRKLNWNFIVGSCNNGFS